LLLACALVWLGSEKKIWEEKMKSNSINNNPRKVILDADFGWMNDSFIHLLYVLQSPELETLGITTIAGNFTCSYAANCVLRALEMLGRTSIPVCPGFDRPLLHERDAYADRVWGRWAMENIDLPLPEGRPTFEPDPRHAIDFIGQTILENPGEVSYISTGPMTNLAIAIRRYPEIIKAVRQVVIFAGSYSLFPRGHGNITPAAEFNVWVDPEASRIVMHSDLPLTTLTMNSGRRMKFTRSYYDQITANDSVIARIFKQSFGPTFFEARPGSFIWNPYEVENYSFIAPMVTAYLLHPELFTTSDVYVEIDTNPGIGYGASYAFERGEYLNGIAQWPIETNARKKTVAYDVDADAVATLIVKALITRSI
jgi:purine nucleosidase